MVKAIETEYAGCKFRSRLEARWAVFFDEAGIKWRYEIEGFELENGTRYLPDFYLPEYDLYCEVKPNLPENTPELLRAFKFLNGNKIRAIIILPEIPAPYAHDSVFWYRAAYWHNLKNEVVIERVAIGEKELEGKPDIWIYTDRIVGAKNSCFVSLDYAEKNNWQFDWGAVHDQEMDYGISYDGSKVIREFEYEKTNTLNSAYKKARQARFEYGETPKR